MILGVDPGYANCGWSVVSPSSARVVALGVISTVKNPRLDIATDRLRRTSEVSAELRDIAHRFGVLELAAEEPLGHGAASAVAANMLPWGALIDLAGSRGALLRSVRAKTWQHAVLDMAKGAVDYDKVEALLAGFVGVDLAETLAAIKKALRTHALDGVGIGLLGALRPHMTTVIVERRAA
jgi:Holliday junction resolvasome RuvABC endonuclease subunit